MSVITLFAFDNPQVKTGLRLVIDRVIEVIERTLK